MPNRLSSWRSRAACAVLIGTVACPLAASAADVTSTWSNPVNGVWSVDTNWTSVPGPNHFPNNGNGGIATYDAVINAVGTPYTVTINSAITIANLLLNSANATVSHTSGIFTATAGMNLSAGAFQLNGGTISNTAITESGTGTLVIGANGANLLTGVTVNGDLALSAGSARTIIAGGTSFTTAHLSGDSSTLGFAPGQSLTGTILFEGAGVPARNLEMNGTNGAVTISPTGAIRTAAAFGGSAQIGGGVFYGALMALTNNGLISSEISGRTLTIQPNTFANAATVQALNGGILTVAGGTWTNTGTINLDSTSTVNLGGTFNTTGGIGTFTNAGGTVNVTGTINNVANPNPLTLNASTGSWTLAGGTISGGTLAFANGKTLVVNANNFNALTGVTVNGELTLNTPSARAVIAGGTTFGLARLAADSAALGFAPGQTVTGTILFEGPAGAGRTVEMNGSNGSVTISASGVMRTETGLGGNAQIGGGFFYGGLMALTNSGLISNAVTGKTLTVQPNTFANTGTVQALNGGTLTIAPASTWTNTGTISVDATSTLNLGGTFVTSSGIGTFSNGGGAVNVTGTISNSGNTITLGTATGSWNLAGGTISGGNLAFINGKTLVITATNTNLLTNLTVNGDLTLNSPSARVVLANGTNFVAAHLAADSTTIGFAPGQTLTGAILFEGTGAGTRNLEMNGSNGSVTIGATGVVRTETGLTANGQIGSGFLYGGQMALTNTGLISSQVSGRTLTVQPNTFSNGGTAQALNGGILTIAPTTTWSNTGTINLDATSTVNLGGTFVTASGPGTFTNAGGTVNITGTINNVGNPNPLTLNSSTGSWSIAGGTISGGSLGFANGKTLLITPNNSNLLTGVAVNGDLTLNSFSARLQIGGGTSFVTTHLAADNATLSFAPGQTMNGTILFEGGGTGERNLEMNGTNGAFTIGPTGVVRTETGLAGSGKIGSGLFYGGLMALTNNGLISSQISGRTLTVAPNAFVNAGTLQALSGGTLTINPTTTWSNTGTISLDATSTVNLAGTLIATGGIGTFINGGGTVNLTGTINNTGNAITLNTATGSWTLLGGTISGGTLNFTNGKTLVVTPNNANLLTGVTGGDLTLNTVNARVQIAGGAAFTTAHLAADNATLGFSPSQTVNGTILFEGAGTGDRNLEMNGANGALTVAATGVVRTETGFAGSAKIGTGIFYGGTMALTNNGLISSQIGGKLVAVQPNTFANNGTVQALNGGVLSITPLTTWTNTGSIVLDAASTVNLGGTFNATGGIGTFSNAGGTVNLTGTINNTGNTIVLNSATGTWTLNGGTINGGALGFANGKTLVIAPANGNLLNGVTGSGDLTLNTLNARTQLAGGTTFALAHLAADSTSLGFAPGQTLSGTILIEGTGNGTRHIEMNTTPGTLTIGPAGVIRTETGLTGDGEIGAGLFYGGAMTLVNNGLISSQVSGRTMTVQPATLTNSGTFQAIGGGLFTVPSSTAITNYAAATQTLTGGIWIVSSTGAASTMQLNRAGNIVINAAEISLTGAASVFRAGTTAATLESTLTTNSGTLRVLGGRNFANTNPLTNTGLLELGGGTLTAPTLANSGAASAISGFGTITPRPTNAGTITANGGTLTFGNGIATGATGSTVTINAGAGLDVSAGLQSSSADFLNQNGTLALGTQNFTVGRDYTNAGFGVGNAFNPHAGISGTGLINAGGSTAQALTAGTGVNGLTGGATSTPTLTFGNIHVGSSVTLNLRIANTGAAGSADLRGAVQTSVQGGNLTDARLSGSAVTAGNFGPLAPGTDTGDRSVTLTGTTAGALVGQKVNLTNNFDNVGDQLLSFVGAVYRFAGPSVHGPEPVALGNRHVGDPAPSQLLTITNAVPADGFSEALDATIAPTTGGITASGSINLLGPGATNSTSLVVGYSTATVGDKSGTATISLTSDGTGTSGLANTTLAPQIVNVSGSVYRLAAPSSLLPNPFDFGARHVGEVVTQALTLANTAASDGFSEKLDAAFTGTTGNATGTGSVSLLTAQGSNNTTLLVGIDTSVPGTRTGTATVGFTSNGTGTSGLANTTLTPQVINVSGTVYRVAAPSTVTPNPVNLGSRHLGDVATQALTVTNTAASDTFSEKLDAAFTGTTGNATSTGTISLLGPQSTNTTSLVVGINTSAVGSRTGTATIGFTSNTSGTSGLTNTTLTPQTVNVSATVYRLAAAAAVTPATINFGAHHVGDVATQALTLTNSAASDGFSEKLDAAFTGTTGNATGTGTVALLAPLGSNTTSLVVGIDTSAAGNRTGTATLGLTSNGTGTSGLANTAVTAQVINVSGAVYRLAVPATHTPEPVAFGIKHVGDAAPSQLVTISNSAAADGFSESLNAGISGQTGGVTTNSGIITGLAAGASNATSLGVGITTATHGDKSGTATVTLTSNGTGSSGLGLTVLTSQTVNVTGQVNEFAQPEFVLKVAGPTLTKNSATNYTLDFGAKPQNSGSYDASLSLQDTLLDAIFEDALAGTFDTSTVNDFALTGFTTFSGIAPGNALGTTVTFNSARGAGIYTDTVLLTPASKNASGSTSLPVIQLNIQGQLQAVPEPATLALLLAVAPLLAMSRRRQGREFRRS